LKEDGSLEEESIIRRVSLVLYMIMILNIVLLFINLLRQWLKIQHQLSFEDKQQSDRSLLTKDQIFSQVIQSVLFLAHPSPFLIGKQIVIENPNIGSDIYYHYNDIFHILQCSKTYIIIRGILETSYFSSNRGRRVWYVLLNNEVRSTTAKTEKYSHLNP